AASLSSLFMYFRMPISSIYSRFHHEVTHSSRAGLFVNWAHIRFVCLDLFVRETPSFLPPNWNLVYRAIFFTRKKVSARKLFIPLKSRSQALPNGFPAFEILSCVL